MVSGGERRKPLASEIEGVRSGAGEDGLSLQPAYPSDFPHLLPLSAERRTEGTGQRGPQEAASVHY